MTTTLTQDASSARAPPSRAARVARRTDFDLLRILICCLVIFAHALLIFTGSPPYHLQSEIQSPTAAVIYQFIRITSMPVFFLLAGWSAVGSLRRRDAGRFILERTKRLLVPLIAGTALLGSIIKYIELSHGRDIGTYGLRLVRPLRANFLEFFPYNLMCIKLVTWSHLWFLAYLFLISIILLPLLVQLGKRACKATVPGAMVVYLPVLPLATTLVLFKGYWPWIPSLYNDWTNFSYFGICFLFGAVIAVWPGFEKRLRTQVPYLSLVTFLAFAGVLLCGESSVGRLLVALTAWGAIGAGLGLAARFQPTPTPMLAYLSEATMPVYVLHHVPLLLLAVVLLPLPWPVWLKIMLIFLPASGISLAAYHWLVRPWDPIRWLMGMGSSRR